MIKFRKILALLTMLTPLALPAQDLPDSVILFKNVNIFDGKSDKLIRNHDVLVVRNKIHRIEKDIPSGGTYEVEVTSGGESLSTEHASHQQYC